VNSPKTIVNKRNLHRNKTFTNVPVDSKLYQWYNTVTDRITQVIQLMKGSGEYMISFDGFTATDGSPIYMQIIHHIKRGIVAGTVRDGDELPSRRVLSALLGVNPNTVQKAYRILEDESLIISHTGAKSYMNITEEKINAIRLELLKAEVGGLIYAMRQMGVTKEEALGLIERYWNGDEPSE